VRSALGVGRAFTPRTVDLLRPFIRATAEALADQIASAGEAEFVDAFANQLPLAVMGELLGVPAADHDIFSVWSGDIGLIFALATGGDTAARVERAVAGLDGYLDTLIDDKTKHPADDLISTMVAAWRFEQTVTRAELRNLLVTLVFGAHDNTRHQFSNTMVTFAEHPGQWTLLRDRPDLTERAVTEAMRWRPSAASVFRRAAEDFEFRDVPIAAGTFVTMAVQTAQRDPRAYPAGARSTSRSSGRPHCSSSVPGRTTASAPRSPTRSWAKPCRSWPAVSARRSLPAT
jgi:cytochrome P450